MECEGEDKKRVVHTWETSYSRVTVLDIQVQCHKQNENVHTRWLDSSTATSFLFVHILVCRSLNAQCRMTIVSDSQSSSK